MLTAFDSQGNFSENNKNNGSDCESSGSGAERITGEDKKAIGGFMAGTHRLHQATYGPESPLPAPTKVFLMIQHHLIANWQIRMAIACSTIEKATGCDSRSVKRAIKSLERDKMLLVERRQVAGAHLENIYRLHPSRYQDNPLYQGDGVKRPTFQVISGGKIVDEKPGGSTETPPRGGTETPPRGSDTDVTTKSPEKPSSGGNLPTTRISQEISKNLSEREVDKIDKTNWADVRAELTNRHPGEEHKIDSIYRELQVRGTDDRGNPIGCLPAFMLTSYSVLKKNRSYDPKTPSVRGHDSSTPASEAMNALSVGGFKNLSPLFQRIALKGSA